MSERMNRNIRAISSVEFVSCVLYHNCLHGQHLEPQAQSTFGCIVCHFVACSNARATRRGDASSYRPPVNMVARGRLGVPVKPQGTQTAGWPVRFVMIKLALP